MGVLLVIYTCIVISVGQATDVYVITVPLYRNVVLKCGCNSGGLVVWRINGQPLLPRRGKFLFYRSDVEILDLRYGDAALYSCAVFIRDLVNCTIFNVTIDKAEEYYVNIHKDVIPSNASAERHDKLYWHPKMKRQDEAHYMNGEDVTLSAYFYLGNLSMRPSAVWYPLSLKAALVMPRLDSWVTRIDCDLLEESERLFEGSCYETTCFVPASLAGSEIGCNVTTDPEMNATSILFARFRMFEDVTDTFMPEPGSLNTQAEDERFTGLPFGTPSTTSPEAKVVENISATATATVAQHTTSVTAPLSSQSLPTLNLSFLELSDYQDFKFFTTSSEVCIGENLTFQCLFPRVATELRLWSLGFGQSPNTPQFLKESNVKHFTILGQNGRPNRQFSEFDDKLIFTRCPCSGPSPCPHT